MAEVKVVGQADFAQEVKENQSLPVLVDFFAPWCGHCKTLAPVLDELAGELDGKLKIVKVNVEEHRPLSQEYGVMGLPTMILFKGGVAGEKIIGYMPKEKLAARLATLL